MIRKFLHHYWTVLKKCPVFTAGYIVGCCVGSLLATVPAVAQSILAVMR